MKQSKFLKEHKKNLKKLNKKQLIEQVLNLIEINTQQSINFSDLEDEYNSLDEKFQLAETELIRTEGFLKSAESALRMYENFNIYQFLKHKFSK